jgi:predicted nuclease with TOPRIM domain
MINFEQIKLLETKVAKFVDYVERVSKENAALIQQEEELQVRLESHQKRIDELEVLIMGFKEEQGRIEDGILAALDRLSQFENAVEKSLREKPSGSGLASGILAKGVARESANNLQAAVSHNAIAAEPQAIADAAAHAENAKEKISFNIPEDESGDDIIDPLADTLDDLPDAENNNSANDGELDIF